MIQLRGVTKFYDNKTAVKDLDLEVPRGSLFGLIGPNGAGKTTALKMIATLIKPDEGEITVGDLDIRSDVREVRARIGYMPDAFGTFRGLTCEEYLSFFGRSYGFCGADLTRRVGDVLELTDLGHVRDEMTSALSTGMGQRLSLAKTLLHDPDFLILDEPASGLDPRARIEIRSLLQELGKMGKTIVISSHILADLEEICTHVGIIELGEVTWQGALDGSALSNAGGLMVVHIETPDDQVEAATHCLRALEFVEKVTVKSNALELSISDSQGNVILRHLLDADIDVLSFTRKKVDLESLFLERTRGIVS
jgi:ABC-2 type transport system ATP-binding protein